MTLNVEMVMLSLKDTVFKDILTKADLLTVDSARFGWALSELEEKSLVKTFALWPFFFFPKAPFLQQIPVVTGTDLVAELFTEASKKGLSVGFLGSSEATLSRLTQKLKKEHPQLKVSFSSVGGVVSEEGVSSEEIEIPKTDILLVAFGHGKQEKWIYNNLNKYPVSVMIGVGGALDYLSGNIKRAPRWMRNSGFEWLYRLISQPWRWKRQLALIEFVFYVLLERLKSSEKIH